MRDGKHPDGVDAEQHKDEMENNGVHVNKPDGQQQAACDEAHDEGWRLLEPLIVHRRDGSCGKAQDGVVPPLPEAQLPHDNQIHQR